MDKKLKNAADKIKMPEDMKERIIRACESAEENNITRIDSADGYTEVASGTDRVTSRSRIIRTVGAAAACMVLLAGIGTTGVLLHRQNSNIAGSSAASDAEHSCPFGDFSTFDYSFDAGDGKYGNYSAETYAKLTDFLNNFNWGESVEKEAGRDKEADVEEPMYNIKWTMGDTPPIDCNIHIASDGYVFYQESMMDFETEAMKAIIENSKWYRIDFDAFDRGVQEIITLDSAQSEPDTLYPFGNFEDFEFSLINVDGNIVEYSPELYAELANFLNTFDWGERHEFGDSDEPTYLRLKDVKMYHINWEYEYDNGYATVTQKRTIQVMGGNKAFYYCYEPISNSNEMHCVDREWHEIDFAAFDRGVKEILAKYQAEAPTEAIESAELFYGDHEKLTSANEETMAKLEAFLKNDFIKMLEPTLSDDIVGGRKYYVEYYFKSDGNKKRRETYYIYMDGFVERRMYVADENGEWQSTGDESYQIDMTKLESMLKDDIGVELPEFAQININKAD